MNATTHIGIASCEARYEPDIATTVRTIAT